MAIGDVFKADFLLEGPAGPATFGIHLQENAANTVEFDDCRDIYDGLKANVAHHLLNILASDWKWAGIRVSKRSGDPRPMYLGDGFVTGHGAVGLRPGIGLPSNNAILYTLQQEEFGPRSNGRIFVPGVSETDTDGSKLNAAFAQTEVNNFVQFLEITVVSPSDTGRWITGVVSQKHLIQNPGDWVGAFAPSAVIQYDRFLAIQKRRTTKRTGYTKAA